ncbi:MAG: allantoinase AllB [Pirellulales bacterium]|nr:allantoinase AllB [Pirellulales bacterium]
MPANSHRFALASSRIVTPEGVRGGAVVIADGKVEAVVSHDEVPTGVPVEDLGGLVISPGLVDSHVHINEPGRTEWEGFGTATRAAAAGGITTLVDMPLNSTPVTTTVAALDAKRQAAAGKCWVDVGFHGGLVPGNLADIEPLIDAGVCGIKAFLCDSGLPEFPASGESELRAALPVLAQRDVPLLVHAEIVSPLKNPPPQINKYVDWLRTRPNKFERHAVMLVWRLAAQFQAHVHVVHLASAFLTAFFSKAREDGTRLTVETCPHYLHFCAEQLVSADPRFKCAPPIRQDSYRERLWEGLVSGVIDTIGSDHSPCPPEMKCLDANDWQRAWGGISSLQLTLPIVWRGACSRMVPLAKLSEWLSSNPARLVGLDDRKGRLAAGFDADLCVWDPSEEWTVRGEELQHRHKVTAYEGERLLGRVKRTYVRGLLVYDDGEFPAGPIGHLLKRNT